MAAAKIRSLSRNVIVTSDAFAALYSQYLEHFGLPGGGIEELRRLLGGLRHRRWIGGFCADIGDETVGFCIYTRTYSPTARSPAYALDDLFVAFRHRRRGIATQLVRALADHAHSAGCKRLYVKTDVNDQILAAFYGSVGFVDGEASVLKLEIT